MRAIESWSTERARSGNNGALASWSTEKTRIGNNGALELLLGLLRSLELLQNGLAPVRHVDLDVAFLMTDNIVDAHLF